VLDGNQVFEFLFARDFVSRLLKEMNILLSRFQNGTTLRCIGVRIVNLLMQQLRFHGIDIFVLNEEAKLIERRLAANRYFASIAEQEVTFVNELFVGLG
jgi:hypothetical protein